MNCTTVDNYLQELENGLTKYMTYPVNERSAAAVDSMVKCYETVSKMKEMVTKDFKFTPEKAEAWLLNMDNADGTKGAHWGLEATKAFKPDDSISDYEWECVMNMMYSDYYDVAVSHGVNTPEFYADMASAFIHDKDSKSKDKTAAYYNCIVDVK